MSENKIELTFDKAMERLEQIVTLLEGGTVPLEESVQLYEEGSRLVKLCENRLEKARLQVEEIGKENQ